MIRRTLLVLIAVSLATSAGCVNLFNGSIDGMKVGKAREAIYDEIDTGYEETGLDGLYFMVIVSGVPNSCDYMKEQMDIDWEQSCEDWCSEYVALAGSYLGNGDYWSMDITVIPSGDEATGEYDLGDWMDMFSGDAMFMGGMNYFNGAEVLDEDLCVELCEDTETDSDDYWDADDGTLTVTDYAEESTLSADFEIEFDGDPVDGNFKAEYCDWFDDVPM